MSLLISKTQFKARALELFRQVEESGESIIITDRGQPKLELRRHHEGAISALAQLKGSLLHYDRPFDSVGEEDWEAFAGIRNVLFIPVDNHIAVEAELLPGNFHRDPADRMIVATARKLDAPLVSMDVKIRSYAHVRTIW